MNKLWAILQLMEFVIAAIGVPLFIISLIINLICDVAGFEGTNVFEITGYMCSIILDYVLPVWMFLWVFNGLHALSFLLEKHDQTSKLQTGE